METSHIILIVAGLAVLYLIIIYNKLVKLRQNRKNAFSDIDVQLKQRLDLIPQLVETVKGYMKHEEKVLSEITAARAGVSDAGDMDSRVKAEGVLGQAMMNLFAVAENYPDLKADKNFMQLQTEISDIENKLAAARRYFNNATNELNASVEQFPNVIIANTFGFKQEAFFEMAEAEKALAEKRPEISF